MEEWENIRGDQRKKKVSVHELEIEDKLEGSKREEKETRVKKKRREEKETKWAFWRALKSHLNTGRELTKPQPAI